MLKTQTWTDPVKFQLEKKYSIFSSNPGGAGFLSQRTWFEQGWLVNRITSFLMSLPTLLDSFTERKTHNLVHHHPVPQGSLSLRGPHTFSTAFSLRPLPVQSDLSQAPLPKAMCCQLHVTKTSPAHTLQTAGTLIIVRLARRPKGQDYTLSIPIMVLNVSWTKAMTNGRWLFLIVQLQLILIHI